MRDSETCWELLDLARGGRQAAQRDLVTRYGPALDAYFRRRGADPHQAEDLRQSVLLHLFDGVLQAADPALGSFRGLLGTVAYRVWCSHQRQRQAEKRGAGARPLPLDEHALPGVEDARAFDHEWFGRLLELALERLAAEHPGYYDAIDACLVQGCAQADFAAERGCSAQDVRNWLFRGRKKLHAYLAELIQGYAPQPDQHATELEFLGKALGL